MISVDLLTSMEEEGIEIGVGAAALALSMGRLLSPACPMSPEDEITFVQAAMEWAGLYFHDGVIN